MTQFGGVALFVFIQLVICDECEIEVTAGNHSLS